MNYAGNETISLPALAGKFELLLTRGRQTILPGEPCVPRPNILFWISRPLWEICFRASLRCPSRVLNRLSCIARPICPTATFARIFAGNEQHQVSQILVIIRCKPHGGGLRQNLSAIIDVE